MKSGNLIETCQTSQPTQQDAECRIAIIGIGCIFPDANNPREYWENIINLRSSIGEIPQNRWDLKLYYDPRRDRPFTSYSKICASIRDFKKNPLKFKIPPISAPFIDRVQFLMLEAVYQALEDANYLKKDFPRDRTAVYVGTNGKVETTYLYHVQAHWVKFVEALKTTQGFQSLPEDLQQSMILQSEKTFKQGMPKLSEDTCGGIFGSIIASRINNCFNLGGASLVIDAACSSSLASVDLAVKGLRSKQFDLVFAGGVDGLLDIPSYIFFSSLGALSDKGSFPFDQRADGFVLGEGAGILLLKRLDDAIRDNDKIYALIRGIGTSSDGRAKGITAPDIKGQVLALERTYAQVPFSPDTISLIEAHGTGTWIGDQVELASLNKFFKKYSARKKNIGLGSVKSMIGHLKSASGMAGIIKIALALHHKILPPTINCEQPRKDFDWENSPFYLINGARAWDTDSCPRRAAVDSFGFGGINYHAILEEAPTGKNYAAGMLKQPINETCWPAEIFVFRASARNELLQQIGLMQEKLAKTEFRELQDTIANVANIDARSILTIVAANQSQLSALLHKANIILRDNFRTEFFAMQGIYFSEKPLAAEEKVAFLFPGSGAQYLNMGGDLAAHFPFVDNIFSQVDKVSCKYTGVSMLPFLTAQTNDLQSRMPQAEELLMRSDYNRPALMALEAGIHQILLRCGLKPDMVVGHSLGEYLALYAAGVFDLSTVIDITTIRGEGIVKHCFANGAMASIGLPAEQVQVMLDDIPGFITIANKNCPAQTVVSGEAQAIEYIITALTKQGIMCKQLPVKSAYHTSLLEPCMKPFQDRLNTIKINKPKILIQSNLTGEYYKINDQFAANLPKILTQHMVQPVEFINNVESMYNDGARLFIEVGPRSTLSSFVDNILGDKPHWTAQTNIPNRLAREQILHCLALCIAKGVKVDLSPIAPQRKKTGFSAINKPADIQASSELLTPNLDLVEPDLKNKVVNLVALKTGYPTDVIDIDLDVESELGLDSIKQVEIIRTITDQLNIDFGANIRLQRYKITTLRKLINLCSNLLIESSLVAQKQEVANDELLCDRIEDKWHTNCYRWISEKVSAPLLANTDKQKLAGKHVLLLCPDQHVTDLLNEYLLAAKAKVFVCLLQEQPIKLPDNIDLVLNASSYKEDDRDCFDKSDKWWQQIKARVDNLLTLAKHLTKMMRKNSNKQAVWVEITSLGGDLSGTESTIVSSKAGLGLGLMRCLVQEFSPRLEGLCLDFDSKQTDQQFAQVVCNELQYDIHHSEIGYVKGARFEIRWKKEKLTPAQGQLVLNSKSVVLAIGGTRGITASVCHEIAKSQAQIIIVGKSAVALKNDNQVKQLIEFEQVKRTLLEDFKKQNKPIIPAQINKLAWEKVWQSERLWNIQCLSKATHAIYRQCDIADAQSVACLVKELKEKYGRLDLVINGAGGLILKSTEDITGEEFLDNIQAKALGTACLINALSEIPVNAFINFSSVAGRWGNKGQSSYAAGHEVAAILVSAMRRKNKSRWINLFFGPWLNVGMVRVGDVENRLKKQGSDFITPKAGNDFFLNEIISQSNCNVAFCGMRSIRTENANQEQVGELFLNNLNDKSIADLLGYRKKLVTAQVSVFYLNTALENNEATITNKYLSFEENKRYYSFKHAKKRLEWLAGRLAAKAAVCRYFNNQALEQSAVSIYNLPNGCPQIKLNIIDAEVAVPNVSISHSKDIAIALVVQDSAIGVDVQEINPSISEIAEAFLTDKELVLFKTADLTQSETLTVIWAVKEASRKAIGVDVCSMRELEIKNVNVFEKYIVCDLGNKKTGRIKSVAVKQNNYISAISRLERKENNG